MTVNEDIHSHAHSSAFHKGAPIIFVHPPATECLQVLFFKKEIGILCIWSFACQSLDRIEENGGVRYKDYVRKIRWGI